MGSNGLIMAFLASNYQARKREREEGHLDPIIIDLYKLQTNLLKWVDYGISCI